MKTEYECVYHPNILCGTQGITNCERCGWYEEVHQARVAKIREQLHVKKGGVRYDKESTSRY